MNKYMLKLAKFMQGRYGIDSLYKFLLIFYCVLLFIFSFIGIAFKSDLIRRLITLFPTVILIFAFYRFFSTNIEARREENRIYLLYKYKFTSSVNLIKNKWKYRKTDFFKKCPNCKANLKLKKIPGEHTVRCPSCGQEFKIKNK